MLGRLWAGHASRDVRSVVEGLVPLFVLPRVLGRVQTMHLTVSFLFRVGLVVAVAVHADVMSSLSLSLSLFLHHKAIGGLAHSPFFGGRHGIDIASVEVPVPGSRADGEDGGAGGEGVVLPRGASTLGRGRCRDEALSSPNASARHSIAAGKRPGTRAMAEMALMKLAGAGGRDWAMWEAYRSWSGGGIASRGAGGASGTQC